MRRAIIQAGLLGGAMAVLLGIITLLPYVGLCISLPFYPLAFFLVGLAVVRVAEFQPGVSQAAAGGAAAGFLAATIGGLVAMFIAPIRLSISGGPAELVRGLSPEVVQRMVERGLNPLAVMDFAGGIGAGMACCLAQVTTGVMIAALAAALYAAYRRT